MSNFNDFFLIFFQELAEEKSDLIESLLSDLDNNNNNEQLEDEIESGEPLVEQKRLQYRYGRGMTYRYGKRGAMPYRFGKRGDAWFLKQSTDGGANLLPDSKEKLRKFIEYLKMRELEENKNKRLTYRYGR